MIPIRQQVVLFCDDHRKCYCYFSHSGPNHQQEAAALGGIMGGEPAEAPVYRATRRTPPPPF